MKKLTYTIYGLLYKDNDKIGGAMSPVCFANEMAKGLEFKYNRLGRVTFNDEEVHNIYERGEGLTGYDTLIIATVHKNDIEVRLFVDMGCNGLPIAMMFKTDTEPTITPIYQKREFARKLTDDEIKELFKHIFDNFHLLDIKDKKAA